MSWPWSQLGLPGPSGLPEVRHAYAEKLKTTHPEDDPEGFQRLHSAYQLASRMARQQRRQEGEQHPQPQAERPAPPPQPLEEEENFNFDELLRGGGGQPRRLQEDEEQDFDFDKLLEERASPQPPKKEEQDFDFERLFAEGEAERAEARRRRGEERRKAQERQRAQEQARERERQKAQEWTQKREFWQRREERNTYDRERREQFDQEQLKWQNTETILHTIEMMCNAQVDQAAWEKFFQGPLFQQMKGNLDLIFGLEDFVSTRQDLPQGARVALFLAYGFDKGVSRPEQRPLFLMLLPAWKGGRSAKSRQRMLNAFGGVGGVVGVIVIGMIVTSNYLPGFIILGALAVYGLTKGWFKREAKNLNSRKKTNWYRVCFVAGIVIAAVLLIFRLPGVWDRVEVMLPTDDPREQVCRYLEQDYGEKFRALYNGSDSRFDNVFAPWNETSRMFLAGPDGERDAKNGKLGYTTNYPEMMVLWRLEEFAKARKIYTVDDANDDQGLGQWETSGIYLISLKPYGDGDTITELGELLAEMAREDWYQVRTPTFEIVLCSGPLAEGRLVLDRYQPGDGAFDAKEVQTLYETEFTHAYYAQLIQDQELDRDFIHDGTERYTLAGGGMAELKGETCCKLYGLDEDGGVALEYYVGLESGNVYCVPGDFWAKGGQEDSIQFYRLIHVDATGGMFQLFYPWVTVY